VATSKDSLDEKLGNTQGSSTPDSGRTRTGSGDGKHVVVKTTSEESSAHGDVAILEKETAEQETIQDMGPEFGETNLAVDMPIAQRTMSLVSHNSRTPRITEPKISPKTRVHGKALEDFSWLSRKMPFTGYSKAVKVAEGRFVYEEDENGKVQMYDQSLSLALFWTMWRRMGLAMTCKIIASLITQLSSLVTKQLILWITTKHAYAMLSAADRGAIDAPSMGRGIGKSRAIFQYLLRSY
jgi:hypothetical protein